MISINDSEIISQIAKIKTKMDKYPPYAIGKGLDATAEFLNTPVVKASIYPPSQSGQPFIWSSEKQRKAFFATNGFGRGIPTIRTLNLANSGTFKVEKRYSSLYVYYENTASYAKWVIGQFTQIVGHIARGWKPVNTHIVNYRSDILDIFHSAVSKSWDELV